MLGVVYRGSRWLDGIIFEPLGRKRAIGMAEIIKNSPYFKELRYVMLRRSRDPQIDGKRLNEALTLPVIEFELVRGRKSRIKAWGLGKEEAEAILTVFTSNGIEPEAVSLANLLKAALEHPD